MTQSQSRFAWGFLTLALGGGLLLTYATAQDPNARSTTEILSANTVIYYTADGSEKHDAAWKKTAAHEAMYESGLAKLVEEIAEYVMTQGGQQERPEELDAAMRHLDAKGMSLSVSVDPNGPPIPSATIVLHEAAKFRPTMIQALQPVLQMGRIELDERDVNGRKVLSTIVPQSPGVEIGFWNEGPHLVITAGINAVQTTIDVADGKAPSIKTNPNYQKYNLSTAESEATSVAWMDVKKVRELVAQFPLPVDVNQALKAAGLHNLNTFAWNYGYNGPALWNELHMATEGERTGLLSLMDTGTMTLDDLPPLPANTVGFAASKFDAVKTWDTLLQVARDGAKMGPPELQDQVEEGLGQVKQMLGFDLREDLFDALGDVSCVFTDPDQGFFGTSSGIALRVKDEAKLRSTLDKIYNLVTQVSRGEASFFSTVKNGHRIDMVNVDNRTKVGALMIDRGWLVVGLMPQTLQAFSMRLDGKLPKWTPTKEQQQAFASLPKEFNSITVGDPRLAWQSILKLAPIAMMAGEVALKEERILPRDLEVPFSAADIPPAELVVRPLFPNVSVTTVDASGMHVKSRQSLPGIPFIGGIGEGNTLAAVGVGTALLLPAIQQAREAARRTQSKNNLKQIALALHNYHDVYNHFPAGSKENEKLKPNKRFSWLAKVLPFIEQANLYERLDMDVAWNDEENRDFVNVNIPTFTHPTYGVNPDKPGTTHYAGMAGVGKDAAELANNHPRAGIFGHNRKTRIRDILDGTSNTIMIMEVSDDHGPWAAGGNATYRGLTKKPYINGPDGIGGPSPGGANFGLGDGSVRFISENIDPKVMEALSTKAGGEVIGEF